MKYVAVITKQKQWTLNSSPNFELYKTHFQLKSNSLQNANISGFLRNLWQCLGPRHWHRFLKMLFEIVFDCTYNTRNTFCRTCSLSNATFSFLITWRSSSSKSAAVYKISSKLDDLSLKYGDISIFKMAAVRHLGIVLRPYETTHEVSVAGCSCLSNFMSIWYTDLKIQLFEFLAYLAWNAYSGPQNGVLGYFGLLNVIIHHRDPQKAHPCVNSRFLSYQL